VSPARASVSGVVVVAKEDSKICVAAKP